MPGTREPAVISSHPTLLHIMSYNIRYDRRSALPGDPDFWPDRTAPLQDLLRREVPSVLGVQEALLHQLDVVAAALPATHRMIGMGREGGSRGEYCAIFYDASRLRLIEWDEFWLSDTPRLMGSSTWGNGVPRIATWGRFQDRATGREVLVVNTHFDHESENARIHSTAAVLDLVRFFRPALPAVVMGDFNADAGWSSAYHAFTDSGELCDSWLEAAEHVTPAYGTFPRYGAPMEGDRRIDWILTTPELRVLQAGINTSTLDGRWASDHVPVQVLLDTAGR
jgi:endonuclease/exonuclease/phosphatase family metal-dependent hydrolase